MAHLFRANVVDVGAQSMVIEVTGEQDKINALHDLLAPFGIIENAAYRAGGHGARPGKCQGQRRRWG